MEIAAYQQGAKKTALYPGVGTGNICYPALGLAGESGEIADKVKKMFRDDGGVMTDARRDAIAGEIGDVLWYMAMLCHEMQIKLSDVAGCDSFGRAVLRLDGQRGLERLAVGLCRHASAAAYSVCEARPADAGALAAPHMRTALLFASDLCKELGLSLPAVAAANLRKLSSRMERGTLHGDGDNR